MEVSQISPLSVKCEQLLILWGVRAGIPKVTRFQELEVSKYQCGGHGEGSHVVEALQIQLQTLKGAGSTSPMKARSARGVWDPGVPSQKLLLFTIPGLYSG